MAFYITARRAVLQREYQTVSLLLVFYELLQTGKKNRKSIFAKTTATLRGASTLEGY